MTKDIAIFLDLDNLVIGAKQAGLNFDINLILDYIKEQTNGRIVLRKAYGDWRQNPKQLEKLSKASFHTHSHMRINHFNKNLADMQIIVDTMETLVENRNFSIYVLLTGDRDFTPLVQALRKRGKQVIGVGVRHTASRSFVELCDEYIYYEDMLPTSELTADQVTRHLDLALNKLLDDSNRVRASILRQELMSLSNGEFEKVQAEKGSFTRFLDQYKNKVVTELEGSTMYVRRPKAPTPSQPQSQPQAQPQERPLHLRYRTALKKQRLRVIPAKERLGILRSAIQQTRNGDAPRWRELIESLYNAGQENGSDFSKNAINAVLLVSREANVIQTIRANSLSMAPVTLQLNGDKPLKKAMLYCDEVYLRTILDLSDEEFEIDEAALALYDSVKYVPYLEAIMSRWQQS